MHISEVFRALKRRWYAMLLVLVVAVGVAAMADKSMKSVPTGTATVQVLVDSPVSALVNLQSDPAGLEARAAVLAQAMTSNAVLAEIAKYAGVPAAEVTAQGPYSGAAEALDVATPSEARGMQLVSVRPVYRLTFVAQQNIPIVTVGVEGPNAVSAGKFANAVVPGTMAWLSALNSSQFVKAPRLVHLRQLGDAQAGTINSSSGKMIGIIGAVAVLILGILVIALTDRERRARRREARARAEQMLEAAYHQASAFGHASAGPAVIDHASAPPASGYRFNDYAVNGHGVNAHGVNGHATNGHATNGHPATGYGVDVPPSGSPAGAASPVPTPAVVDTSAQVPSVDDFGVIAHPDDVQAPAGAYSGSAAAADAADVSEHGGEPGRPIGWRALRGRRGTSRNR